MRVIATCVYRNEADIIEGFVRHTLAFCDELILLDHGSTDESPEIVRALQREGLPLHLSADPTLGNVETDQVNRLLHLAAHEFGADWILSLDADEFIIGAADRSFLGEAIPDETPPWKIRSRTYYSQPNASDDLLNPVERITHWLASEDADLKVIVPGWIVRGAGGFLTQGKHQYFLDTHEAPARLSDRAALAHFSLRSPAQYATKLVSKQLQKCRHISQQGDELIYYNEPYALLKESYTRFQNGFPAQRLSYLAQHPEEKLVHEPIDYRGGALRYTQAHAGPDRFVRELLDLAEALARSAEPAASEGSNDGAAAPRRLALELTSHPSPGHTEVLNTIADPLRFRSVMLAVDCPPDATELRIELRVDPGLVEISEIILHHAGPTRGAAYGVDDLQKMVRIGYGGAVIAPTDVFRVLVSKDPVLLIFSGWRKRTAELPVELQLRLRVEHRLVPAVLLSAAVLNKIAAEQRELNDCRGQRDAALKQVEVYKQYLAHRAYTVGSAINFSTEGNGSAFTRDGWGVAEAWGTWTVGDRAELNIHFDEAPKRPLRLRAKLFPFVHETHRTVDVSVVLAGEKIAAWTVDSPEFALFDTPIAADKLRTADCPLVFEIANPISPAELGISADARRLGIGLQSIEFQWADSAAAVEAEAPAAIPSGESDGNVS